MGVKVLVVDDSLLMHKMYALALRAYPRAGVEVLFAANGREGMARLQEHPDTALVLLDINMPELNGLEFLARLQAEPALRDVPVVLQSTEDQQEDMERGLQAGARGYLKKPFTPPQLHQLLDTVLA
jgi:CheY-like chemotaxis protein